MSVKVSSFIVLFLYGKFVSVLLQLKNVDDVLKTNYLQHIYNTFCNLEFPQCLAENDFSFLLHMNMNYIVQTDPAFSKDFYFKRS